MKRNPWIIDVASGRPAWLQWRDRILTVMVWIAYAYLIRDVFIDLYRLGRELYDWTFKQAPPPDVLEMFRFLFALAVYAVVVVVNGAILIGWATYNKFRFGGPDARKALGSVSPAQLGELYGFPGETIAAWQQAGSLVVTHDADGKLLSVVPGGGTAAQPPVDPAIGATKQRAAG
jgi:biofilm PGA synthesis protein PgaD